MTIKFFKTTELGTTEVAGMDYEVTTVEIKEEMTVAEFMASYPKPSPECPPR